MRFEGIATELDETQSLYQLLHSRYGVDLASTEETIEAVLASEGEAELLGMLPGAPLLRLSRQSRDADGIPTEYVRSLYRGDRFRFRTHLERSVLVPPVALDVRLRAGVPEDAAGLAAVFVSAWRDSYPGIVADAILEALDEREIADWLRTLIAADGSTMTVAEAGSHELVGFCRHGGDPDDGRRGHVYSLYVAPGAGGRGLGRRLLAHALDDLQQRRLDPVTLWVFERNEPALRLYASFGFAPDGGRRVKPEYGADEIRLRRVGKSAP